MTEDEAADIVRKKWDDEGECGSCGWHGSVNEYEPIEVDQEDIDQGYVHFACHNKCDEDSGRHRGVRIDLR